MISNWKRLGLFGILAITAVLMIPSAEAQKRPQPPKSVRIYVFDCGSLKGLDPGMFHFKKEELAEVNFVDVSYLIVHPKGTLMWDTGTVPDSAFKPDGSPVVEGIMTATKPLLPQLAAIGYTPADITYLGLSHYHSDHTANANSFAGSTWLVHQTERDFMFSDAPKGVIQPPSYSALKTAKTKILPDADYDVFGDGTVVIKYTPGHTQGHQVLFVKLAKAGPVVLAGDLWHYPEERNTDKTPTFEFNHEQSLASRAAIEAYVKKTGAQVWIEHDMPTFNKQKKSPEFYE
jgi:glyoxylase-like metal-dependent hydrolase (beta-lactamase superfamily II)